MRIEFEIPTRGLIGYRSEFLTDTRGLGIMSSRFIGYGSWRGEIASRNRGSLVSIATGPTTAYSIEALQERSVIFVEPMERVYTGQIVGENSRTDDMECNPTKRKHLTNHRSSTKDIAVTIEVPRKMSLEQALGWIAADELVEVTPKAIRMRKAILDALQRKRAQKAQTATRGSSAPRRSRRPPDRAIGRSRGKLSSSEVIPDISGRRRKTRYFRSPACKPCEQVSCRLQPHGDASFFASEPAR